ncbi:MAG TPA: hypothetical protein VF831_09090 [Anaerolineales bacterium]
MKYLVIANPRPIQLPPEQAVSLYQAVIAWTDERLKNGKLEVTYGYPGGGGIAIANVNSQEELFDELLTYPLYGLFDWKIKVLVDLKHAFNSVIEYYKKMGTK